MTTSADDWSDLQRTWQAQPDAATTELADVRARIGRARRVAALRTALDVAACAVGVVLGTWSLLQGTGTGVVVGLAALGFTAFGAWIAWRSARLRRPVATGTVAEALDAAIALERSAERWARATVPVAVGAVAFLAVIVLASALDPDLDAARLRRQLEVVGLALLAIAIATGAGHWLALRARARREVLERRRRELES